MRSTFMGLEASKKGLFVQQSALYTTGHNISNANTEGYSRQRVNMSATPGYPHPGLNSPTYPGHLGTGVEATSVQRIRDEFIDRQYRQESNKLGYWESTLQSINQMEDILSEPSEFGINQSFNDFWKALEDVSANPEGNAPRKVALAKAEALADSFNYNYKQLEIIQGNIGNEISVSTKSINTLLKQIAAVNEQVQAMEPNGYVMNDLYDARDVLVDKLNELIPVSITPVPSGGNASKVAEGSLTIKFNGITLVEGKDYATVSTLGGVPNGAGDVDLKQIDGNNLNSTFAGLNIYFQKSDDTDLDTEGIQLAGPVEAFVTHNQFETGKGKLLALVDAYGHVDLGNSVVIEKTITTNPTTNTSTISYALDNATSANYLAADVKGIYPEMLQNLDKLANSFMNAFNAVHQHGHSLDGIPVSKEIEDPPGSGTMIENLNGYVDFFQGAGAKGMQVNGKFLQNPSAIAASTGKGEEGNGKWAIELANLQFLSMKGDESTPQSITLAGKAVNLPAGVSLDGATFQDFYIGMIGDLAVKGQEAVRLEYNSTTLQLTISNNRASMSSVSLDEEMTNMITFQQAYNANARMITVVDEILEKIINGMGRVGL